jgi:hypothetical protein
VSADWQSPGSVINPASAHAIVEYYSLSSRTVTNHVFSFQAVPLQRSTKPPKMLFKYLALAGAVGTAIAQRPTNTSICDYYTTALLKNNTAANQKTLLTLVVNTAVIGNCELQLLLSLGLAQG